MKIRSNEEMYLFEKAIDSCRNSVLLLTPEGEQYDLKTPFGRYQGISQLLKSRKDGMEPEIYTNSAEDEIVMFEFLRERRQLISA